MSALIDYTEGARPTRRSRRDEMSGGLNSKASNDDFWVIEQRLLDLRR